jgi:hypothetical protein
MAGPMFERTPDGVPRQLVFEDVGSAAMTVKLLV